MLTIQEIKDISFRKASIGGYKPEDVDEFIDEVEQSYKELLDENEKLIREINELNKKIENYHEEEGCIRSALVNAQKIADASVREARHKAEIIIRDASMKAEKIVSSADDKIIKQKREMDNLKKEVEKFRSNLMTTYKKHLELIQSLPESEEAKKPQPLSNKGEESKTVDIISNTAIEDKKTERSNVVVIKSEQQEKANDIASSSSSVPRFSNLKFGEDYDIKSDSKM